MAATPHSTPADTSAAVDRYMQELEHPHHGDIMQLRALMLAADDTIAEGVKWNAPSFRTTEYFATTNLRVKGGFGVILHLGAKVRASGVPVRVDDPHGLLRWHSHDRASLEFRGHDDFVSRQPALTAIVRQWITHL